jgi:hypothetical protein
MKDWTFMAALANGQVWTHTLLTESLNQPGRQREQVKDDPFQSICWQLGKDRLIVVEIKLVSRQTNWFLKVNMYLLMLQVWQETLAGATSPLILVTLHIWVIVS